MKRFDVLFLGWIGLRRSALCNQSCQDSPAGSLPPNNL
jgi:hypothetical protein